MNVLRMAMRAGAASIVLVVAACSSTNGMGRDAAPSIASQEDPRDDRGMYLDLIRKMQEQGAWYASLAHIDAHRQRYATSPELRLLHADALRETGQDAEARGIYETLRNGPHAAAAAHGLGLLAIRAGNDAEAAERFADAATLAPLDGNYLGDMGFALMRLGRLDAARVPLTKAAELSPDSARAVSNLALWALLSGQAAQAESIMARGQLPGESRAEVYRLAQTLRRPPPVAQRDTRAADSIAGATQARPLSRTTSEAPPQFTLPMTLMDRLRGTDTPSKQDALR